MIRFRPACLTQEGRLIGRHPELLAGMSGHVVLSQP